MAQRYVTRDTPRSTAALNAFCEAGRLEHNEMHDHLDIVAQRLESYLRRSLPNGTVSGLIIAKRVTRPLRLARDANQDAARAFIRCWHLYEEMVLNASRTGNVPFKIH